MFFQNLRVLWIFPRTIHKLALGCRMAHDTTITAHIHTSPRQVFVRQASLAWRGEVARLVGMTDWDERYRIGDTPWEKGEPAPPLMELIERMGVEFFGEGPVLVPGCGLGHDVRALAASGLKVMGLDLSGMAIGRAWDIPIVNGEIYEKGNFLDPAWRVGRSFTAIWEHTCFCAISPDQRRNYAEAVTDLLIPGGILAGVFFLTPHDPGEEETGPPFATTVEELEQWFSPWFERIDGWVPQRAYPGREGREWTGLFRKRMQAGVAG